VCADFPQKSVRNSGSAEIIEESGMREIWLAVRCTGRSSSPGSLQGAPHALCFGLQPVAPEGRPRPVPKLDPMKSP
jgi:hypothetical protein